METNQLTGKIIGCAIEVHRNLGPGLLESLYESCLIYELKKARLGYATQVPFVAKYKDSNLELIYKMDLVIENAVILELKAVESLNSLNERQLATYLRLSGIKTGLLINFNTTVLRSGIRRIKLN